jgi:probable O-glycosylation ligase (exosortase A-associated)
MRSLAFFVEMLVLLPVIAIRPFVGVLIWSWISFMSPHKLLWGPASGLPWAMITFVALLIGCMTAREPKRFAWNPTTALIAAFMICITLTSLVAMAPADDVFQKWSIVMKVFFVMLITASLLTSKERIHALIWIMVLSLAYFGLKGGGFTLAHGGANRVLGPPGSMIADNNHLAAALLVCVPLMNYLRMQSKHLIVRIILAGMTVLTLFSVVGSYSRGALLGLLAMSAFLWAKSKRKLVAAVVIPLLVGSVIAFMPAEWVARMHTIDSIQGAASTDSGQTRTAIWHVAWQMAVHRPLTGAGFFAPYDFNVVRHFVSDGWPRAVHSIWFEVLGEHGFVTFFVWLGITVSAVVAARRIIKSASGVPDLAWCVDLAKMSQVSMVAYCVAGTFLSLSYWDFYFTMLVAVAATHQYVRQALGETAAGLPRQLALPARLPIRGGGRIGAKARAGPAT